MDELPYKIGSGLVWDKSNFTGCLEAACASIGYDALRAAQVQARAAGRYFGIGLACYAELTGIGSRISVAPGMPLNTGTETARIAIDATGSVTAAFGVASHGQGLETTLAQVVADQLGVRMEDIRIVHGDSAAVPNATGTYASRSMVLAGGAATLASGDAARESAAGGGAPAGDGARPARGCRRVASASPAPTRRSASRRWRGRSTWRWAGCRPTSARSWRRRRPTIPYLGTTSAATHAVTVEIDPDTYELKIGRYVVAEDCGRLVNPMIVEGQVHGGVAQGIAAALYEEVVYNEDGQILTASLVDYVVPAASEIPHIEVVHLETPSPTIGGFRGMGEGGTIGAPAAVANAIADALAPLGVEIFELPVTPERLFRLIEAAKSRK